MPLLLGLLAGLCAAVGLSLSNGLLALGHPGGALGGTAFGVGCLAALGATASDAPGGRRAAWLSALGLGALLPGLARPNPSLEIEFGIDRNLLLPQLAERFGDGGLQPLAWGIALPLSALGAALVLALPARRALLVRALLVLLAGSFLVAAAFENPRVEAETARPPVAGNYTMDAFLYLRVQDLLKQGSGYYRAFYLAYTQRSGPRDEPQNTFNWRPPALFYLWSLVPGGPRELLAVFRGLAVLALVAAFGLVRTRVDEGLALGAPALLGAYFLYGAVTPWFATQEYWASAFMLIGFWGWMSGRPGVGALFLALAVASREHFGFLLLPLLFLVVRGSGRERAWAAGALLAVGIFYLGHLAFVSGLVRSGNPGLAFWRAGGLEFLRSCLEFGTVYVAGRAWLWFPLLAAGALGACLPGDARARALLASSALVPLGVFLFLGQEQRFYWGVAAVPQLLVAVPLLGGLLGAAAPAVPPGTSGELES